MKGHGWMAAAIWMGATAACGGSEPLKVIVLDQVGVDSGEMTQAMDLGRRLFDVLGIGTDWKLCRRGETCSMPQPGTYIRLSVVPWAKGAVLGFANPGSVSAGAPQAYAFHGAVARLSKRTQQAFGVALACVMVHESLHLLGLEHAAYGVMRENFDAQDLEYLTRGRPMMNAGQMKQLREGLNRLNEIRLTSAAARP